MSGFKIENLEDYSIPYKESVIGFSLAIYLLEQYLNYRQYRKYLDRERPKQLEPMVTQEDFSKAQAYGSDKIRFEFISAFYGSALQGTLLLVYDVLPLLWNWSGDLIMKYGGYGPKYEITQSIVFFIILSLINALLNLPVQLYSTFVIEQRHGFNNQTLSLFFADLAKMLLLGGAIGIPLLAGFLWIVKATGDNFYFYVWVFMMAVQFILITIYPTLIQPLFNKCDPLPDGELKTQIEALASRIKFPLKKLFVIDGSKRSNHSNAYFYGFFKNKRIVLFDTLLQHSTNDEIVAVLAHELGHWSLSHTLKHLLIAQLHLFIVFFLFSQFIHNSALYRSFGFGPAQPTLIGFMLFQYIFSPVENLLSFLMNILSRKHEYEADEYAMKLGYAEQLKSSLIKLSVKNKNGMHYDRYYSAYHHSHPTLLERLQKLEAEEEKPKKE
ncbi:uncharacterized protein VTP21DRAFT_2688 [Calcarisporiella thermophila]|uniref:uncharacterized protein n=1 Tax=Calcarisporiella thermophila TaxID=911321 RepID=UPI0037444715